MFRGLGGKVIGFCVERIIYSFRRVVLCMEGSSFFIGGLDRRFGKVVRVRF